MPVLAVHDELVIECDEQEADTAREWLQDGMWRGMQALLSHVPVVVEPVICRDWSGAPGDLAGDQTRASWRK